MKTFTLLKLTRGGKDEVNRIQEGIRTVKCSLNIMLGVFTETNRFERQIHGQFC